MSSSPTPTSESSIIKVIFTQRIARFACRKAQDLLIMNFVCKDFEETMQAHHTFNLVLYDNVLTEKHENEYFLQRTIKLLSTAPAWVVYQWTVVNEYDETQRERLKDFLRCQAKLEHGITVRRNTTTNEDASTTHQLFRHVLESCVKLGIAKEVLETSENGNNIIVSACMNRLAGDSFKLLVDSCVQHGVDMKKMLEQEDGRGRNCIMLAATNRFPVDSFRLLLESCVQHGADVKQILTQQDYRFRRNCVDFGACGQLSADSFKVLLDFCEQHIDVKELLERREEDNRNTIMIAAAENFSADSFTLLLESCLKHSSIKTMLEQQDHCHQNSVSFASSSQLSFDSLKVLLAYCQKYGDIKKILQQKNKYQWTCLTFAAEWRLATASIKLLIAHFPSSDFFQSTLLTRNVENETAVTLAATVEIKTLLKDPGCWKNCREWCASNGITF